MKMKSILPHFIVAALSLLMLFAGCDTGVSSKDPEPIIISEFPVAMTMLLTEDSLENCSTSDTVDWYELTAEDDYINIELMLTGDSDEAELTLYTDYGVVIDTASAVSGDAFISYGPAGSGTYNLRVAGTCGSPYGLWWDNSNCRGSYPEPADGGVFPPAGDTSGQYSGRIEDYTLDDTAEWHRISPYNDNYYINVELFLPDMSSAANMVLYDNSGTVLKTSTVAWNNEHIQYGPVKKGNYYVKVERTVGSGATDYQLWWYATTDSYNLYHYTNGKSILYLDEEVYYGSNFEYKWYLIDTDDDFIDIDLLYSDDTDLDDDADWWRLPADSNYIDVQLLLSDASADAEAVLYNSLGEELDTLSVDEDNGYLSYGPVDNGTYYLKVEKTSGADGRLGQYALWWNDSRNGGSECFLTELPVDPEMATTLDFTLEGEADSVDYDLWWNTSEYVEPAQD